MESTSTYCTPMRTPTAKNRRRAISPTTPSVSSPYEIIELDSVNTSEATKTKLLEQDRIIQDLRSANRELHDRMKSGSLNESILIESSNTISTKELRIHRRDIRFYEEELEKKSDTISNQRKELEESKRRINAMKTELQVQATSVEKADRLANDLQAQLRQAEEKAYNTEREMAKEISELRVNQNCRSGSFETRLAKFREELKCERDRNSELCSEIMNLKEALREARRSKEEMSKSIMESSMENRLEEEETRKTLLTEMKSLSTHIVTRCLTPDPEVTRLSEQIGSLKATIKHNEQRMEELKSKELALNQSLEEARQREASTEKDLESLRKKLVDIEGNQELTHKYLLEEANKVKQQKAELRCELLQLQRDYDKLKEEHDKLMAQSAASAENSAATRRIQDELAAALSERGRLERENAKLQGEISALQAASKETEQKLASTRDELEVAVGEKGEKQALKSQISKLEETIGHLKSTLIEIDTQFETIKERKDRADAARLRAVEDVKRLTARNRELEQFSVSQRVSEAEVSQLKSDKDRLTLKNRYLSEELQEAHRDYREELARMAREISQTKSQRDVSDREKGGAGNAETEKLKLELSKQEGQLRSLKRQIDELKEDNDRLQTQVSEVSAREKNTTAENIALRQGLADAVEKLEQYKQDMEAAKHVSQEMAQQLADKTERMTKLEDDLSELEEVLKEKEALVAYLQSQINVKQLPKVSRRSTLLRIPSESSVMNASVVDPGVVRELETEREKLLEQLEEKKKKLTERREMPPPSVPAHRVQPSAPPRTPLSEKNGETRISIRQQDNAKPVGRPVMRHDIPHRWKDLRNMALFSIKCAVCFVGVSTFCKARRCTHCNVVVHTQCAARVVNTCGLPDECASYYLDSHTAPIGNMNGWIKMYSDDFPSRSWQSAWGLMDENSLSFYDKDGAQGDLSNPVIKIDLTKEHFVVRAGVPEPVKSDEARGASIIHVKTATRNLFILAPSTASAKRWVEALQSAQTRRSVLTRKTSSFSEQSCLLVLPAPNNLKIHTTVIVDEFLVIGAQGGLFFTSTQSPRVPIRIDGVNSVTAMEVMPDVNMLALVVGSQRHLALIPLSTLKNQLTGMHPSIRPDIIGGFDSLHVVMYHQQEGQRYLCVADMLKIHILKHHPSKDVFMTYHTIDTSEPAMCMQSASNGFYFGADSFYFVELARGAQPTVHSLAPSHVADYPLAILPISEQEVLLAYQNYGMFMNSNGQKTRERTVEWEQMPMEFVYTAPYLFVIHYDSIEIMQVAEYNGMSSDTILDEREVFECRNAHIVGKRKNGDVFLSISNKESTEVHRFNATNQKRNPMKRKGISMATFHDKRNKC